MKAYCIYKTIEIFYRLYPSTEIMRFFLYVQIPTEAGNDIVKDPYLVRNIEEYINDVKAEAAYFGPSNGNRTMFFVVNMDSADMIPKILEPLFQKFKAKVEMHPIMVLDDLKKSFS
jgi:hypothetical protein